MSSIKNNIRLFESIMLEQEPKEWEVDESKKPDADHDGVPDWADKKDDRVDELSDSMVGKRITLVCKKTGHKCEGEIVKDGDDKYTVHLDEGRNVKVPAHTVSCKGDRCTATVKWPENHDYQLEEDDTNGIENMSGPDEEGHTDAPENELEDFYNLFDKDTLKQAYEKLEQEAPDSEQMDAFKTLFPDSCDTTEDGETQEPTDSEELDEDDWMQNAFKPDHKGELHRELGVPSDKDISMSKLDKASHSRNKHMRHQAQAALNARR